MSNEKYGNPESAGIRDKTRWVASGLPAPSGDGFTITSVTAHHKRSWTTAVQYENTTYEFQATATIEPDADVNHVAAELCTYVRETVELWAAPELESTGRLQPHVLRKFSGVAVARQESDTDCKLAPTGISPSLHMAQAEMAQQLREEIESELTAKAK